MRLLHPVASAQSIAEHFRGKTLKILVPSAPGGDRALYPVVFAPFFSTKASGLGMGLSISRSIVEAHGGQLSAARNPDHDSAFRMTPPLNGAD